MDKNIKYSVVCPVYNQEELVYRCLESIPKRADTEIIVVNDGSTDRTLHTLERYKEAVYPELQIITYDKNMGVSYARNKGLEASSGKYVIFIDSDDYVYPNVFNEICDKYYNEADMLFYDMEDNKKNIYVSNRHNYKVRVGMFKFIKRSLIGDTRFIVGKQYGEDGEFFRELLKKKPSMFFSNLVMYHYNYPREGSLSYNQMERLNVPKKDIKTLTIDRGKIII